MKFLEENQGPAWHAKAACNHGPSRDYWPDNHNPDTWHPNTPPGRPGTTGRPTRSDATAAAIAICNTCPVKQQCFEAAVENNETHGIWGGVDFERPSPAVAKCGTSSGYNRHLRDKESACDACLSAHRKATRASRARRVA